MTKITKNYKRLEGQQFGRLFTTWQNIKNRCYNNCNNEYKNYGGRGIAVCDEWLHDFMSFYNWSMVNCYNDNLTIDRIDNNGNYEPNNCRWVTMKQQQQNKRSNRNYTINGETHCLSEWCEILGLKYSTVQSRIQRNWSIEKALEV